MNWPKQRCWGWYATLLRTPWFCIKLLRFTPHGKLSLQRHKYRTELWFLLNATGFFRHKGVFANSWGTIKIQPNEWHQFNALDSAAYILEIQYGRKVSEDDIERK